MDSPRVNPYPIRYFGYGAMRNSDMVSAVIGRIPHGGVCSLGGYELIIQRLLDVPGELRAGLEETWGKDFGAYRIRPKEGSYVEGWVWEVNAEELALIRNWEGNGVWTVMVESDVLRPYSHEQIHVLSDAVPEGSTGSVVLDVLHTFLNEREKMLAVAKAERETYLSELQRPGTERK